MFVFDRIYIQLGNGILIQTSYSHSEGEQTALFDRVEVASKTCIFLCKSI